MSYLQNGTNVKASRPNRPSLVRLGERPRVRRHRTRTDKSVIRPQLDAERIRENYRAVYSNYLA